MSDPTDIVEYLRKNAVFNYRDTYLKAADEIERLREERDQARRELCHTIALNRASPRTLDAMLEDAHDVAAHRCWDCFKEKP